MTGVFIVILSSTLFVNNHVSNQVSSSSRESTVQADIAERFVPVGDYFP
jgi:hypothetical protein